VQALVSLTERDHLRVDGPLALERFACALREAGMCVETCREATAADVEALGSTWAKRLGIPRRRPAWLLVARKD
jgi:hypothetical protein